MKKINLNPKAKKGLIITGSAVICIGIAAIAMTMTGGTPANTNGTVSSEVSSEPVISIAPIEDTNTQTQSTAPTFNPENKENRTTELTTISKPTSQPPAPKIEGDSSKTSDGKETPPKNQALTDKKHKPSYTKPPVAPGSKSKPSTNKPTKPKENKHSGGKQGQVYVEGFGWIDDIGEGEETTVGNPGDELTGNKVGIMD